MRATRSATCNNLQFCILVCAAAAVARVVDAAFLVLHLHKAAAATTRQLSLLRMGNDLYGDNDKDVARFVPKSNNNNEENLQYLDSMPRLFDMQVDGTEAQSLLPRLSRRLDSGVECYFERTDKSVFTLSKRTACHPLDAAWALEACRGDMKEAWLCISTAQSLLLDETDDEQENGNEFDDELFQLLQSTKEQGLKDKESKEEARAQAIKNAFRGGTPDQDWLPSKNPRPVDDEPWFTG